MKTRRLLLICTLSAISNLGIAQSATYVNDWAWGRGNAGYESGEDIAVSNDEYNYTTGVFEQTVDFHPFSSVEGSVTSNGGRDVFICKQQGRAFYLGQVVWRKLIR